MTVVDVSGARWSISRWAQEIAARLAAGDRYEPIVNVNADDHREFDAIFLGGGAAGRFGAAYLRAMGGRPLIIERWPFLGGSCPHQACVPHHVFSDVAAQLLLERTFSGKLWFQDLKDKMNSIKEVIDVFRRGRTGPHAIMNFQSKEQLDLEFVLNTPGRILGAHAVSAAGCTYRAKNLVLATGARPQILAVAGQCLNGVFDFAGLVDDLDYEPGPTAVVVGGGKTAIEYGCFFNATGRRTLVVSRDRPLSMINDGETRAYLLDRMEEQGMEFWPSSELTGLQRDGDGCVRAAVIRTPKGEIVIATDFVFLGIGECPNSEEAREVLGVAVDADGFVEVDNRMQTSVPYVYAIGDLVGTPMEMYCHI